jgi:hypothetical protein
MVWFFTELSDETSVRALLINSKLPIRLCESSRPISLDKMYKGLEASN